MPYQVNQIAGLPLKVDTTHVPGGRFVMLNQSANTIAAAREVWKTACAASGEAVADFAAGHAVFVIRWRDDIDRRYFSYDTARRSMAYGRGLVTAVSADEFDYLARQAYEAEHGRAF